jgi:hypothetical protein
VSYRLSPATEPALNARHLTTLTLKQARRVAIFVVGATVALLGLVMLLTPGPGRAVIVAGLAILAIEFAWARRLLAKTKARMQAAGQALRRRTGLGGGEEQGPDGEAAGDAASPAEEPRARTH